MRILEEGWADVTRLEQKRRNYPVTNILTDDSCQNLQKKKENLQGNTWVNKWTENMKSMHQLVEYNRTIMVMNQKRTWIPKNEKVHLPVTTKKNLQKKNRKPAKEHMG